jgi:hypothetical protein
MGEETKTSPYVKKGLQNNKEVKSLILEGKWEEARKKYTEFKKNNEPKFEDYTTDIHRESSNLSLFIEYHFKKEGEWFKDLLKLYYDCPELLDILLTARRKEYKKALEQAEKAIIYSPTDSRFYWVQSVIYFYMGNLQKSFEINDSKEYENLFLLNTEISNLVDKDGKFDLAIEKIDKHLKKYPDDHYALFYKGLSFYKKGDLEDAKDFLKQSVSKKQSTLALYYLKEIYINTNKTGEALLTLDSLISIYEKTFDNFKLYGKEKDKLYSFFDLHIPTHIADHLYEKAQLLFQIGRETDSRALLLRTLSYLENVVYPIKQEAMQEDPLYFYNTKDSENSVQKEIERIYENSTNLLNRISPTSTPTYTEENGNKSYTWLIWVVLIIVLLILIF